MSGELVNGGVDNVVDAASISEEVKKQAEDTKIEANKYFKGFYVNYGL